MEIMMIAMMVVMLTMGMNHMGMSDMSPGDETATTSHPGEALFNNRCKSCHALERRKLGPAVTQMSHDREVIIPTITNGRGLMPAFGKSLTEKETQALSDYITLKQESE